jgi:hypothetical protein
MLHEMVIFQVHSDRVENLWTSRGVEMNDIYHVQTCDFVLWQSKRLYIVIYWRVW